MIYKRSRKNIYRSKRRIRKRMTRKTRVYRNIPVRNSVMKYKRKFFLENWQPSTVATSNFWRRYNQSLSNIPNSGDLVNFFDFYKVCAIKLELIPRFNSFDGSNTTDTTAPGVTNQAGTFVHVCYDLRSITSPSGVYTSSTYNNFAEQGRIKTYAGNRKITIYYKPVITSLYAGNQTDQYTSVKWLPTSQTALTLYGPQIFMQDPNFNGSFGNSYDIFVTQYVMLKGTR